MKKNNHLHTYIWVLVLLFACAPRGWSQDRMPPAARLDLRLNGPRALHEYKLTPDTLSVRVILPEVFRHTQPSGITAHVEVLAPVMEKLRRIRIGATEDTLRMVHIGDSHVRGRIYPGTVGLKLNEVFGAVSYTDMGVNGATCLTFTHPDRIEAIATLNPELLILSFGTNESHNRRYNATVHYHQMDELVKLLRTRLPKVPILLTTPPGSYDSFRQRRRRRTYAINPRTDIAVNTIRKYAQAHKLAVWDMYNVVGGKEYACRNWWDAGLMRPDHVHYLPEGYILQGELLFQALINAYNAYVSD